MKLIALSSFFIPSRSLDTLEAESEFIDSDVYQMEFGPQEIRIANSLCLLENTLFGPSSYEHK
jgi:hypothetical protein